MDALAVAERAKYDHAWRLPEYRRTSPGLREAARAFDWLRPRRGQTLTDWGAGTGRATAWFRDYGVEVLAVDISPAALETDVPFRQACLWDLPADFPVTDIAYCCDVMEHIPPEKVDAVLSGIADHTAKTGWFRICTVPDTKHSALVGDTLHLTVQDAAWWSSRLAMVFSEVELIRVNYRICVFRVMK